VDGQDSVCPLWTRGALIEDNDARLRIRRLAAILGMLSHRPSGVEPVIVAPRGPQPAAACEHEATGMHMTCMPAGAPQARQSRPPHLSGVCPTNPLTPISAVSVAIKVSFGGCSKKATR
jgi:hypothetical protein